MRLISAINLIKPLLGYVKLRKLSKSPNFATLECEVLITHELISPFTY